jgi:hypothetical protein
MRKTIFALALLISSLSEAAAAPIIYTISSYTGGTLDGNSLLTPTLPSRNFTIIARGDTDNLVSCGGVCLSNNNIDAHITLDGLGTFSISTPTRFFSNGSSFGFSLAGTPGFDLIGFYNISPSWDLVSSLGPITADAKYTLAWSTNPLMTSGGALIFNPDQHRVAFSAVVGTQSVPEAHSFGILWSALAGLLYASCGRRKVKTQIA